MTDETKLIYEMYAKGVYNLGNLRGNHSLNPSPKVSIGELVKVIGHERAKVLGFDPKSTPQNQRLIVQDGEHKFTVMYDWKFKQWREATF